MERDSPFGFGGGICRVAGYPDSSVFAPRSAPLMSTVDRFKAISSGEPQPPITGAEFTALIAAAEGEPYELDLKEISTLVFCTALRVDELFYLRWDDVDLDKRMIFVRGGRDRDERRVPFADTTEAILRARRARGPQAAYVLGSSPERVLVAVSERLKALSIRVLKRPITLHTLRLGFLAWWSSVGGNRGQLALIAGTRVRWSDPAGPKENLYVAAAKFQAWRETLV